MASAVVSLIKCVEHKTFLVKCKPLHGGVHA